MEYQIEVDYIRNACGNTYWPDKTFHHKGNPIEACNYRIKQIIETKEYDLNDCNITCARIYPVLKGKKLDKLLTVNYRHGELKLNLNIKDFIIKI